MRMGVKKPRETKRYFNQIQMQSRKAASVLMFIVISVISTSFFDCMNGPGDATHGFRYLSGSTGWNT